MSEANETPASDAADAKAWVEYSEDLSERRTVDFGAETITIEVATPALDPMNTEEKAEALREKLEQVVSKKAAEAFADDQLAQAIESRASREVTILETAEVPPEPILVPYLTGAPPPTDDKEAKKQVTAIVDHMLEKAESSTSKNGKGETVHKIVVPLTAPKAVIAPAPAAEGVPAKLRPKARAVWPHVVTYADKAEISGALVYAVIETESAFDPLATSHIPAYGLMQIVPRSAGLDAEPELGEQLLAAN